MGTTVMRIDYPKLYHKFTQPCYSLFIVSLSEYFFEKFGSYEKIIPSKRSIVEINKYQFISFCFLLKNESMRKEAKPANIALSRPKVAIVVKTMRATAKIGRAHV